MLLLTRRAGEKIIIGDKDIVITVDYTEHYQAKLTIDAGSLSASIFVGVQHRFDIADDVWIKVIESNSKTVKLGIEAPRGLPVHREEIYNRVQQENK